MSLANLLKIGQLKEHPADAQEIARLLAAAERSLADALTLTLGIEPRRVAVLDTLRRKRNLADYTGEDVDDASVAACIDAAEKLLRDAKARIGNR